jgi:uncharacterized protein
MITMSKGVGVLAVLASVAIMLGTTFSADGQDKKAAKAPAPGLTFEVYKDKGGDFRYRIVDETGTNLGGASKGYGTKDDVLKVVNTIKKEAAAAKIDDQTTKK